jgi:hypothetical protein
MAAVTVGGCKGQDEQNSLGDGSSDCVYGEMRAGGPSVAMEISCRQLIDQSFVLDSNIRRFWEDFSHSKNMVFNVKKLLNVGVDLRGQKEAMWANEVRSCGFWPLIACFHQRTGQRQFLLKALETVYGPLGPEAYTDEKYVLWWI